MSPALLGGDGCEVSLPGVRKDRAGPFLVEPAELLGSQEEDATQHQLARPLGVGLRVRQRQRRTPGTPEDQPAVDAQVGAQPLHVVHQVPGRVVSERRMGRRSAAAALIEEHDSVGAGVEDSAVLGLGAAARTPVDEQRRFAVRVAGLLEIDLVTAGNLQHALVVGLDLRVEGASPLIGHGGGSWRLAGRIWAFTLQGNAPILGTASSARRRRQAQLGRGDFSGMRR